MKKIILLLTIVISGCNNNVENKEEKKLGRRAENKANFEECIERAEEKYRIAFSEICIHQSHHKKGQCSYNIEIHKSILASKDNEITACATMYAPKQ